METLAKKEAILASLEAMNSLEIEKVLNYVKTIHYNPEYDRDYKRFKREAMHEIKKALGNSLSKKA